MRGFRARPVPSSSWRTWLQGALHLSTRRLAANVSAALLLLVALEFAPLRWADVAWIFAPAALGVFVAIAASGAETVRRSVKEHVLCIARLVGVGVLVVAAVLAQGFVVVLIMKLIFWLLGGGGLGGGKGLPPLAINMADLPMGQAALGGVFFWLLPPITFLFIPLCAAGGLNIRLALLQSVRGLVRNMFVWRVSLVAAGLAFLGALWHGAAAVPFYPVVGAMMYLAYRHIYFGESPQDALQPSSIREPMAERSAGVFTRNGQSGQRRCPASQLSVLSCDSPECGGAAVGLGDRLHAGHHLPLHHAVHRVDVGQALDAVQIALVIERKVR